MTPPAAAGTVRRPAVAPRRPRRVSGPARPRTRARTAGGRDPIVDAPLGLRLARVVRRLPDAPFLDRLIRGRGWIALVAVALIGIVFMQVSMLKLNAGISRAVASESTLDRQNSSLRADVSRLESAERIQTVAGQLGMVDASTRQVRFLQAGRGGDAAKAAQDITAPDPTMVAQATTQAPAATTTAATTTPPPAQATPAAPPATTQAAPATTTATQPGQQQAPAQQPQQAPPQQQPATTPPGTSVGGAVAAPTTSGR